MKIDNPHPFEKYTCYKNFHKKMGRWQVCIVPTGKGKRRTILFSKFLMSIHMGRILKRKEEVDHKDQDKTNDSLDNLEIVTQKENARRRIFKKAMVTLECPECKIVFERAKNQTRYRKRSFCSRKCVGKFYFSDGFNLHR